ncbi:MAG: protein kinase, partial [Cyanobacteria bacterium P01_E01_bin.43]
VQAVSCSLEIQRQLVKISQAQPPHQRLEHRIGIHLGDVFFKDDDVMGNGVNIAARLQTEAEPGGICISQIVYNVVKSRLSLNASYAGPLRLKNIQEPQPAYHINPALGEAVAPESVATPVEELSSQAVTEVEPVSDPPKKVGAPRDKLRPGSKIGGRYVVQRVLGQGGFGRSYLVEDSQRFGEACVLKEFFPRNASKRSLQKALDLFKREAKTLYQISHPQVPKFLAGFTQEQRLFIVQEYVHGVTYSHLLKERKREGHAFTEHEVKRWMIHMLQVLEYLHNLNIVHRDISPDNVMYCRDRDLPVLIDFGLVNDAMSEILSGDLDEEDMPRSATVVGKFGYSPPEQIQLGQCFPCSDLYALGVTAIVLLTGRYPRELMNRNTLDWQWRQHVDLTYSFTAVLQQLIHRQPQERYQSAREVLEAITPLLDSDEVSSPLPQSMMTTTRIDLSPDPNAAPVFNAPLQVGSGSVLQEEAFVDECRQALTRCIGPMATLVLEDVLDQYPDASPQELVDILAAQLSDGQQASQFVSSVQVPRPSIVSQPPSGLQSMGQSGAQSAAQPLSRTSAASTSAASQATNLSGASQSSAAPPEVSSEFVNRCRQALKRCVGPIADMLLEDTLTDYPNLGPQELVAQLAAEIPNPNKAEEFQQQLRS